MVDVVSVHGRDAAENVGEGMRVELVYRPMRDVPRGLGTRDVAERQLLIFNPETQRKWCRYVYAEYEMFSVEESGGFEALLEAFLGKGSVRSGSWENSGAGKHDGWDWKTKRRVLVRFDCPRLQAEVYYQMCLGRDDVLDGINVECFTFNLGNGALFVESMMEKIVGGAETPAFGLHDGKVYCERPKTTSYKHEKICK
jgi:hypothetical protein